MAVSVTVTNTIVTVTSTGGVQETLDSLCTAIGDTAVMEKTGTDPYIYTLKHGTTGYRSLYIKSGCELLFEQNDELRWTWNTSGALIALYLYQGSEIEVNDGFTFDFGYSGTYTRGYVWWYGMSTMNGLVTNEITLKNYRQLNFALGGDTYWRYITLKDIAYTTGELFYFDANLSANDDYDIDMQYVTVINNVQSTGYVKLLNSGQPVNSLEFKNWTFENFAYLQIYALTIRFTDCIFKDLYSYPAIFSSGNGVGSPYNSSRTPTRTTNNFQPHLLFDGCTFTDMDLGVYSMYLTNGTTMYLKDCEFIGDTYSGTQNGIIIQQDSKLVLNNITWTNMSANIIYPNTASATLHVREIDITVKDLSNNPIENASVVLRQAEGKEWHNSLTNLDGKILNIWGNNPILVEKEEVLVGNFTQWSNSEVGGQYHILTVSKEGYSTETQNIETTEDKILTINLTPIAKTNTVINNSTFYDSTIN